MSLQPEPFSTEVRVKGSSKGGRAAVVKKIREFILGGLEVVKYHSDVPEGNGAFYLQQGNLILTNGTKEAKEGKQ